MQDIQVLLYHTEVLKTFKFLQLRNDLETCVLTASFRFVQTDSSSVGRGFFGVRSFSVFSPQPEWQTVRRASEPRARSAQTCSRRSMSVNQASPSARIRNKFHILRKQLWLGCCENWSPGWRAPRTHSSLAGGVLPWEAITAGCQLTASFQSESGLAWSSGTL